MRLNRTPNIADADAFYEELVNAQRDLSDEQAERLMAKIVLLLANHIGDPEVLTEAIALARQNTLTRGGKARAAA